MADMIEKFPAAQSWANTSTSEIVREPRGRVLHTGRFLFQNTNSGIVSHPVAVSRGQEMRNSYMSIVTLRDIYILEETNVKFYIVKLHVLGQLFSEFQSQSSQIVFF